MEDQIFMLQTEEGGEQQCRVVFTFDSDEHSYVLFTLVGDDGMIQMFQHYVMS